MNDCDAYALQEPPEAVQFHRRDNPRVTDRHQWSADPRSDQAIPQIVRGFIRRNWEHRSPALAAWKRTQEADHVLAQASPEQIPYEASLPVR